MLGFFKNVEIIGVVSGNSTDRAKISSRPSHTFVYKTSGESLYQFGDKQLRHKAGSLLFIPEGESYSFGKVCPDSTHRLVNFHADCIDKPLPQLINLLDPESVSLILRQMEKSWLFEQGTYGNYERLSMFYRLLALLVHALSPDYAPTERKELITPAINYLDEHIFDVDLKAAVLSDLCGMTGPTFRKIFSSKFGVSPKKYIINQRMLQAKTILESGEFKNVSEVAYAVGFDDPLYFSKLFKSFYGSPPSKY